MTRGMLIKEMPENLRPRERLLEFGAKALSDQELLAIILRTGTRNRNVIDVAHELLVKSEELSSLREASIDE